MNGDEAQSNPLPPGFDDVEPLAVTGCGRIYGARVASTAGHVEYVAVALLDTPVRGRDARRLRSDCLKAVAIDAQPGVLAVRDLGFTKDHRPFLVTDIIQPGTLATRIEQQGALPVGEVVALGRTLAGALSAAHRNGILHLGVAPDVVFLTSEGPALGHFGVAWAVQPPSQPDVPATAIMHAPRELFEWTELTAGSDVYGLASVLRTALTGRAPFETEARTGRAALYHRLVQGAPPKLNHPGVPEQLAAVLDRMMDPDPARRPVLDDVVRILEEVAQTPGLMVAAAPIAAPIAAAVTPPEPEPQPEAPAPATQRAIADESPAPAASPQLRPQPPSPQPLPTPPSQPQPQAPAAQAAPAQPSQSPANPEQQRTLKMPPVSAPQPVTAHQAPAPAPVTPLSFPPLPPPVAVPQHIDPPFAQQPQPTDFPTPRPTPPATAATTPPPRPVEPRRRNTGLLLLVAAGVIALAAGVVWGVATAPKKDSSAAASGPVVAVPTFSGAQRSAYEVTDAKASASGDGVTVTWSAPRQTAGVQSYIVVVNLHNQSVQSTTVAGQTLTATFKGLTPATTYCVSVVTFAVAPGDSGPHTAPPDQCALVTTPGSANLGSSGGSTQPTRAI